MKKLTISALLTTMFSINASATGLYLTELNATDVALAGAGWAARANDATTAFNNPAGMTRLDTAQYEAAILPIYISQGFSANSNNMTEGTTANADAWLPSASFFYVRPIDDKWSFGLSMAGYFGLGLEYDDDWIGRYYNTKSILQTVGIQPSVGYKVNDNWSVGLGVILGYTIFEQTVAVKNIAPDSGDAELELKDEDTSIQFSLGVLYEFNERTRIGLQYLSEAELDMEDVTGLKDAGPILTNILEQNGLNDISYDFEFTLPQAVSVSLFHQINDRWNFLANATWQEWSEFGQIGLFVDTEDNINVDIDKNFNDTHGASIGVQYQLNDQWMLNSGVGYHSAMVDTKYRTPDLPMTESYRFGFGGVKTLSESSTLKLSAEILWFGDFEVERNRGPVTGQFHADYEDISMTFLALSYAKTF
ncbi:transporter [Thalassotalea sp. HSM 43]|uniref:OmpP1/FadL family transporter n=1 Tax=Thalassotalea sp. HSM 43 TaxID=2552945 RepID=UPI00108115B6|nr:OmpP1/FadL family transporter [Thalassotalea sp. HSM 43]QBY06020.1 transporter [Thalassotalea sp. HSM 43]